MKRLVTLSVCFALIAGSLAAPESSWLDRLSESDSTQADLKPACDNYLHLCCLLPDVPKPDVDPIVQPASDRGCKCVPYYQCQNGTISVDGQDLIDIRTKRIIESISTQAGVNGAGDEDLDVRCTLPDALKHEDIITPRPAIRKRCGQRNPDGVGFLVTGAKDNKAQFGEFPWMVAILHEEVGHNSEKLNVYQCGGALIHTRAIITTAYCVKGRQPSELKVRAGEWETQTETEIFPHQDRDVEFVIVHKGFNSGSLQNDIAILILKTPFDLTENVDLVCLPAHNETFDAARCLASGWGKDAFGKDGQYQAIPKKVELPVVARNVCQSYLRNNTRLGKYFILNSSFICAGGEAGKDTCQGDGGSPLVCPIKTDPSRYVQAGIVTWGIRCGENQIPGVYTNVALFRPWIDEQLVCHNLDITVYQP